MNKSNRRGEKQDMSDRRFNKFTKFQPSRQKMKYSQQQQYQQEHRSFEVPVLVTTPKSQRFTNTLIHYNKRDDNYSDDEEFPPNQQKKNKQKYRHIKKKIKERRRIEILYNQEERKNESETQPRAQSDIYQEEQLSDTESNSRNLEYYSRLSPKNNQEHLPLTPRSSQRMEMNTNLLQVKVFRQSVSHSP